MLNNYADSGGGMSYEGKEPDLKNNVIKGNDARLFGDDL